MLPRRRFDGNWRVLTLRVLIYLHSVIVDICEEINDFLNFSSSNNLMNYLIYIINFCI